MDKELKAAKKAIRFTIGNPSVEYLRIEEGGDFYVKDKLVTNDMEIYKGFTAWFKKAQDHTARLQEELDKIAATP
jgi:hypothetical protein